MDLLEIEKGLWSSGYEKIAGCDEVGRGCLFGSVLAAAVVLPQNLRIEGVTDSKQLSPKKREYFYEIIKEKAIGIGVGTIAPSIIDQINIKNAVRLAMRKAVATMKDCAGNLIVPDFVLVDAESVDIQIPQRAIIKGDSTAQSIAAASIVAKVIRDRMCLKWAQQYPQYGLEQHKGYGTKQHVEAILLHGPSELHRRTFLKKIL